jgi:hypothetical protein
MSKNPAIMNKVDGSGAKIGGGGGLGVAPGMRIVGDLKYGPTNASTDIGENCRGGGSGAPIGAMWGSQSRLSTASTGSSGTKSNSKSLGS